MPREIAAGWRGMRWLLAPGFPVGLVALLAVGFASQACSPEARHRVLSTVFDGVPPPGTPPPERRKARRTPEPDPPKPAVIEEAPTPEYEVADSDNPPRYETFDEIEAAFPKDVMGNLDWVAAARAGLVRPQAAIDPKTEPLVQLPLDILFDPGIPNFEVVFPHEPHTFWLRCDNCHPQIFTMRAGANPVNMAAIFQGEYCGRCHGKVAFAPQTGCPRCHVKMLGGGG